MGTIIKRLKKFVTTVDNQTKIDFIDAYFYMGIIRMYMLFVPFKKLRKKMGKSNEESPEEVDDDTYLIAQRIASIIAGAAKYTPWESKCLVKAATAQKMLKKKGIKSTLYLGAMKDTDGKMVAHAWLRCGKMYVTGGGKDREGFPIVAKFCSNL